MKIFIFIDSRNILTNKRIYSPFEIFVELLELLEISLSSRRIETKRNKGKEITSFSLESTYVSIDGCTVERGGVVEKLRATGTRWAAKRSKYNWHASHPRRWNRRWNRERPIINAFEGPSDGSTTIVGPSGEVASVRLFLPAFILLFSRGGGRVSR